MRPSGEKNSFFQASQLTILLSYTIFATLLVGETFLMKWETWPLVPIAIGVIASWVLHIRQSFSDGQRVWIYSAFIMFTFFFYGSHITSVFDTVAVMAVVMILYTMTGIRPLITFLQFLYYVTLAYGIVLLWRSGEKFDSLIISRTVLHIAVITAISCISRFIIKRWTEVLDRSDGEIEKLTDATDRLNDFMANVSHEIRTPINAVIGLTGVCINEEDNEEKLSNLNSVRNAGRRVAEQISDILDFTEIDRGRLSNNCEDYTLSSVLSDLVGEIRPYKSKDIELVIDVDPAIPSVMNTDVSKLKKILRHLILNGLKYTPEGGVYVRLYAIPEEYGVNLLIKVTDTGIGMSEEETERVLERYYQADSGRARQGGGLGLGLTIVSGFTAALGGFMTVRSKSGVGTTVTVSLPQKVVEPSSCMSLNEPEKLCLGAFLHLDKYQNPNVREYYNIMIHNIVVGFGVQMHRVNNVENLRKLLDSVTLTHLFIAEEEYSCDPYLFEKLAETISVVIIANGDFTLPRGSKARILEKPFYCFPVAAVLNSKAAGNEGDSQNIYCKGIRALVVDDEPMNLVVAQYIFKRYGMSVTTVSSGQESIDLCRENDYDIVFMDHMMPGMDGVEAMKRIRASRTDKAGRNGDMPIVALTANAVSSAKEMFLSEGFDGFVSKPIELVELERTLKKVLPRSAITSVSDRDKIEETLPESTPEVEEPAAPEPKESAFDRLAKAGIDTSVGMSYCMEDVDFYESLLTQFVSESAEKRSTIAGCFESRDLKNYAIYVHALKSTSKMLGHLSLSKKAEALEFASKDGNLKFVEENHQAMMEEYIRLTEDIVGIYGIADSFSDDLGEKEDE